MKTPTLVHAGTRQEPWVVVRSGFWGFQSFGFFDGEEALVVDPGIFAEDMALLETAVCTRATTGGPRRVRHVVVTHAHHDHLRGWNSYPGAEVSLPRTAAEKSPAARERILAAKAAIDTRLEIDDPEFAYPVADRVFESECALTVGHQEVVLIPLPGHSNCCSVVWFPSISTLYSADYLVTPGLPYCRWEIGAFRQALDWLGAFCRRERVQRVWPSHYVGHTSPLAIQTAIAKDRTYLEVLEQACQTGLRRELKDAAVVEAAERAVLALGGHHDRAGRLQHHDNAKRMLACLKP